MRSLSVRKASPLSPCLQLVGWSSSWLVTTDYMTCCSSRFEIAVMTTRHTLTTVRLVMTLSMAGALICKLDNQTKLIQLKQVIKPFCHKTFGLARMLMF